MELGPKNNMSWREAAIAAMASEPCRTLLRWAGAVPGASWILERTSYPRIVFDSFEEAWAAARRTTYAGHDHPEYIQEHLELATSLRPSDYAALYWLLRVSTGELRVFDYGGHVGNLYYAYSQYLEDGTRLAEWIVFDLPRTIEVGLRIAAEREAPLLQFTDSLKRFSQDHILLVSGAFHYWEKSVEEFVGQFPYKPEHILVNRTPATDNGPAFITVQYRKSYAVPCVVRNARELISDFAKAGYALVDRWSVLELAIRMPFFPDRTVPQYSGFYFRRSTS